MLAGEAVIATWNGITPEGRDEFYAWHIQEHIPERVGFPGFRRGRHMNERAISIASAASVAKNFLIKTFRPFPRKLKTRRQVPSHM